MFFCTLSVAGYFGLLFLNGYVIRSNFVLIGVFQELLTIPLILLQLLLLVVGAIHCVSDRFRIRTYSFWSFIILLIMNSLVFGSFIRAWIH